MLLVLVRHGSAVRGGPYADVDRPLLEAGVEQAENTGRALARLGVRPASVLTSPAQRCRHTAELLATALSVPGSRLHTDAGLAAGAGAGRILAALAARVAQNVAVAPESATYVLVGHQPDLEALAQQLLGSQTLELFLPPGGCMALDLGDGKLAPPATLLWLLPPKVLGDGAT